MPEKYDSSIEKIEDSVGEFIIYRTEDDLTEVHLRLRDGSVWMSQSEIAELFDISVSTVSRHLKSIYEEEELDRGSTVSLYERVSVERGRKVSRQIEHYNLDAIMAVGYRVRGPRGVQFRNWASSVLKDYLIKGFAMNDEKLKDPTGKDYFDELLARIRDIRASEARFYQQILDVIATAVDYSPENAQQKWIFQKVQNKLHYAVAGQTAAEILETRCNPSQKNLGLQSFKGKIVRKRDIYTAKNYLVKEEMETLNRLTVMYLDYAKLQAERRNPMTLDDWVNRTDRFIEFNDYPVLTHAGQTSMEAAKKKVAERYEVFDKARKKELEGRELEEQIAQIQRIEQEIVRARKRRRLDES